MIALSIAFWERNFRGGADFYSHKKFKKGVSCFGGGCNYSNTVAGKESSGGGRVYVIAGKNYNKLYLS